MLMSENIDVFLQSLGLEALGNEFIVQFLVTLQGAI